MALYTFADEAIITTNPEVSSVHDSDRILGILRSKSRKAEQGGTVKEHLLITRYSPERVAKDNAVCTEHLRYLYVFVDRCGIPESQNVLQASNAGEPVIHQDNAAAAGSLQGRYRPLWVKTAKCVSLEAEKKKLPKRLFEVNTCHCSICCSAESRKPPQSRGPPANHHRARTRTRRPSSGLSADPA